MRKLLMTTAGVLASAASATALPTAANAQEPNSPKVDTVEIPASQLSPKPFAGPGTNAAADGTCFGATAFRITGTDRRVVIPTTSNNSGNTNCLLVNGNSGSGVSALQTALEWCPPHIDIGEIDGKYGDKTTAGVKKVQDFHGIAVDGKYGPQTRNAMYWPEFVGTTFINRCARMAF
jgi:peptidoglycan hydrolase-like protein with peptidoglycan-binding domain